MATQQPIIHKLENSHVIFQGSPLPLFLKSIFLETFFFFSDFQSTHL